MLTSPAGTAAPQTTAPARDAEATERRFKFGQNWQRYSRHIDDARIAEAEGSLQSMLGRERLDGMRFIDIGSGSGLFSLAARRLGATVHSFDYDHDSVAATAHLRERYRSSDAGWAVEQGSVLDRAYLARLGQFDVVYSWGVLHHTGAMWEACENASRLVAPGGTLFISLYNDQGTWSGRWKKIKRFYCSGPVGRAIVLGAYLPLRTLRFLAADLVWGRNPLARYSGAGRRRGMSQFHDIIDWVGGYPFEVARPEQVFEFFERRGFRMIRLRTVGGSVGCNEFVFRREGGEA
jgi:2-polyprenyl-3-methyl-5-hydroxy-6-metoxy-1,4-benzoquinol methylase